MATGVRPFAGGTPVETASLRLHHEAPRPKLHGKAIDGAWEWVITNCLAREPEKRPSSIESIRKVFAAGPPQLWIRRKLFSGFAVAAAACSATAILTGVRTDPDPRAALDHYVRGSKLLEEFSPASAHAALEHFGAAMSADPAFALAVSAMADTHLYLKNNDTAAAGMHLREARRFAMQAVQLDRKQAEAHLSLAAVHQAEWNWSAVDAAYRNALTLKPSLAKAHRWFGGLHIQFGRCDVGLAHANRALELDPHDRSLPATLGLYHFLCGKREEARWTCASIRFPRP